MNEPLIVKPFFREKIWGGKKLHEVFGYDLPSDKTGEAWVISAHPNGPSLVENGPYKGMNLAEVWEQHREIFGNAEGKVFPLLTKILDAADDLSVQVHPDDRYGMEHEGELGKTECWYIIDADKGAEIIYGHHAQTKEELEQMILDGKWDDLLNRIKVEKGDFFYVPSGTIHAIGGGITILETQQSSDTTYRVYDYDRKDDQGNLRELHVKQSVDVTTIPHVNATPEMKIKKQQDATITTFVQTSFFDVYKWEVKGRADFVATAPYTLVSVLEGNGTLIVEAGEYPLTKGTHLILPNDIKEWTIEGNLEIIASNN